MLENNNLKNDIPHNLKSMSHDLGETTRYSHIAAYIYSLWATIYAIRICTSQTILSLNLKRNNYYHRQCQIHMARLLWNTFIMICYFLCEAAYLRTYNFMVKVPFWRLFSVQKDLYYVSEGVFKLSSGLYCRGLNVLSK